VIGYPRFEGWSGLLCPGAHPQIPRVPRRRWRARMPRCQRRTLRRIQRDVATSDPGLARLFSFFTRLADGEEMPWIEKVGGRAPRLLARLGRCAARLGRHMARLPEEVNERV
jgi:hypothetical protein